MSGTIWLVGYKHSKAKTAFYRIGILLGLKFPGFDVEEVTATRGFFRRCDAVSYIRFLNLTDTHEPVKAIIENRKGR